MKRDGYTAPRQAKGKEEAVLRVPQAERAGDAKRRDFLAAQAGVRYWGFPSLLT